MMSPNNNLPSSKPPPKEEQNPSSSNKKGSSSSSTTRPQEQALKCPRCDSPNTKFCYYNNYSLTQPRHFCKTCRRYWTKGGALRNVPIGGGCRKNKKIKSSSRLSADSRDSGGSSSSELGGLKFFHGLSSPAMDFQLGGLSFPRINPSPTGMYSQFSSFGESHNTSPSCFSLDPSGNSSLMGFNYPSGAIHEMGSVNVNTNLASSIESLSSINQDLHWKLQQQRLAMLFCGENQKESCISSTSLGNQTEKPQPILFQNLEISKPEVCGGVGPSLRKDQPGSSDEPATEWFFGSSYGPVTAAPPTNRNGNGDNSSENMANWNGVQAWSDLHQYSALP